MFGELTAVVDTPVEASAQATYLETCARAGLAAGRKLHWQPYDKLGPHSLVTACVRMAATDTQAIVGAIDAACASLAKLADPYDAEADPGRFLVRYESGVFAYERILDWRVTPFVVGGLLWLHLAAQSDKEYQEQHRLDFD